MEQCDRHIRSECDVQRTRTNTTSTEILTQKNFLYQYIMRRKKYLTSYFLHSPDFSSTILLCGSFESSKNLTSSQFGVGFDDAKELLVL